MIVSLAWSFSAKASEPTVTVNCPGPVVTTSPVFAEARRRLAAAPQLLAIFDGAAYAREFEAAIEDALATPAR